MVSSSSRRSSRRSGLKSAQHSNNTGTALATRLSRAAVSPAAKTAYVVVGVAGLAALAAAILGPRRLERDVLNPLKGAVVPPAEKLWEQSRPLRRQIASLLETAGPAKEALAHRLQSWAGHFRAT